MSKFALTISYLGTNYNGWQAQDNAPTVQAVMTDAASKVFSCKCLVTGCSRTDSGVHAKNYLCTVMPEGDYNNIPCENIPLAFNNILPPDISVKECKICPDDFHPRYGIYSKQYVYTINNSKIRNPFLEDRAYTVPQKLDVNRMNEAAALLIGKHDFSSFMANGSKITDTHRTIFKSVCEEKEDGIITYTVEADGFLYNMVRIITGTLIDIGRGKNDISHITDLLTNPDRSKAGLTVPAYGLCLDKVKIKEGG